MALNIQTFKTRALTALVFVIIMLAGIFINAWSFVALFLLVMLGCLVEFVRLCKKINPVKYMQYLPLSVFYIVMPLCMMISLGITYEVYTVGPPFEKFVYSPLLPCTIIFSIWINDTMAYMVGSFIGKTPLSKISPKKTWEGTIGGAVLCMVVIPLLGSYIPEAKEITWQNWLAIAALCAVFGTLGDLLESKLKRMADVKDSGTLMPGHGGFLDRFDSLLVATPAVWLYVKLIW